MLGFILGAAFIWALPRHEPPVRPIIVAPPAPKSTAAAEPRELTTIEAVFDRWSEYAVWDDDLTQVALWNGAVGDFAEFYEVLRVNRAYYFRSIPHLTNRIVRHGKPVPAECPLQFTETDEQYREWREHDRYERPAENLRPSLQIERTVPVTPQPTVDTRSTPGLTPPPQDAPVRPTPSK